MENNDRVITVDRPFLRPQNTLAAASGRGSANGFASPEVIRAKGLVATKDGSTCGNHLYH